jgi:hypothetical protein
MHPLAGDLTQLSDEELLKKLNELYDRLKVAYYMSDPAISYQLRMLLESYKNEQARRAQIAQEKFARQNKKLTDRIDIN